MNCINKNTEENQKYFSSDSTLVEIYKAQEDSLHERANLINTGVERAFVENILKILKKRFRFIPDDFREKILKIADTKALDELFDAALDCGDLEAFQKKMNK